MYSVNKIVKMLSVLNTGGTLSMTNYELARDMVNTLSVDWSNPHNEICDPSCGSGMFLLALAEKLEEYGHSRKHIVTKMLFGYDIDDVQVLTATKTLQMFYDAESNIQRKDFLTVMKEFDITIGNPPFQATTAGETRQGGLWFEFVKKSAEILKPGGTMAFVSPRWTGVGYVGTKAYKLDWFKQFHMTHISFDAKKYFPKTGSTFCWYVMKKDSKGITKIMDWDGELNLNDIEVLPFNVSPENISILNKVLETNKGSEYGFKRTQGELSNYDFTEDGRTRNNEGKRKVYIINGRFIAAKHIKIDATGDTEDAWKASMPLKCKEVVGARSVFTSKLAHHMWNMMGGPDGMSQSGILQKCMPIVDLTKKWTDEELYDHFGLTNDEIDWVESNVV